MLFMVGLGLGDVKDITVKGLEIVRTADRVYLESYTSMLNVDKEKLEEFYGRPIITADRELVEQGADIILKDADVNNVAVLVVGDPFGATTHTDLVLRAREMGIQCQVIHNASIINAVGCCGLQLYSFGEVVSIPYWTETWQPDSYYDKIAGNRERELHTLCLLDIKVKEPTLESLTKKIKEYQPPRFMSVNEAAYQLTETIKRKRMKDVNNKLALTEDTLCVGLARVGGEDQRIVACSLNDMLNVKLGPPLHSLIITGKLQPLEMEYLSQFSDNKLEIE